MIGGHTSLGPNLVVIASWGHLTPDTRTVVVYNPKGGFDWCMGIIREVAVHHIVRVMEIRNELCPAACSRDAQDLGCLLKTLGRA